MPETSSLSPDPGEARVVTKTRKHVGKRRPLLTPHQLVYLPLALAAALGLAVSAVATGQRAAQVPQVVQAPVGPTIPSNATLTSNPPPSLPVTVPYLGRSHPGPRLPQFRNPTMVNRNYGRYAPRTTPPKPHPRPSPQPAAVYSDKGPSNARSAHPVPATVCPGVDGDVEPPQDGGSATPYPVGSWDTTAIRR
jgi:hypothetical protein